MTGAARQLCPGSSRQLMEDADDKVVCPECLKSFDSFTTQRNRAMVHPVVPAHMPDLAGRSRVEIDKVRRRQRDGTPRPW